MVKFAKYLAEACVPEWQAQYVDYRALKKAMKKIAIKLEPIQEKEQHKNSLGDSPERISSAAHNQVSPSRSSVPSVTQSTSPIQDDVRIVRDARQNSKVMSLNRGPVDPDLVLPKLLCDLIPKDIAARQEEILFFTLLQKEIAKVYAFHAAQELFFQKQVDAIHEQIKSMNESTPSKVFTRKMQIACRDVFRGIELLQSSYRDLNYVAVAKILKKHDKTSEWNNSKPTVLPLLRHPSLFPQNQCLDRLRTDIQDFYVGLKQGVSRSAALESLRPRHQQSSHSVSFAAGMTFGFFIALVGAVATIFVLSDHSELPSEFVDVMPIYRGQILILVFIAVWGGAVAVFEHKRINYGYMLHAAPQTQLRSNQIILLASTSLVFVLTFLVYFLVVTLFDSKLSFNPGLLHFVPFLALLLAVLFPFHSLYGASRLFFFRALYGLMVAPFHNVKFKHFFLADCLTSSVRILFDVQYTMCFYLSGQFLKPTTNDRCFEYLHTSRWIIAFAPFWWRFAQCLRRYYDTKEAFPHLANAGKYASAILVTFCNLIADQIGYTSLKVTWICVALIGTLYSFCWDLIMDWGLFDADTHFKFLRKRLLLTPMFYYFAICSNFVLRIAWVMTISPSSFGIVVHDQIFLWILALLEIVRRGQWIIIRLENEHLNNCGKFRVVNVVPQICSVQEQVDDAEQSTVLPSSIEIPPLSALHSVRSSVSFGPSSPTSSRELNGNIMSPNTITRQSSAPERIMTSSIK